MLKPVFITLLALSLSACGLLGKDSRSTRPAPAAQDVPPAPVATRTPSTPAPTPVPTPQAPEVVEFTPPEPIRPAEPPPRVETHPRAPALARSSAPPLAQNTAAPQASPAVMALLQDAEQLLERGETEQSAARLERALRIEPNNALLWQRLALVRLEQGQLTQAETLALRANEFARGDRRLMARSWRIIAQARSQRGDEQGAHEALQRARELDGATLG